MISEMIYTGLYYGVVAGFWVTGFCVALFAITTAIGIISVTLTGASIFLKVIAHKIRKGF